MSPENPESWSEQKTRLLQQYRTLFGAVSQALIQADPLGLIEIGAPDDEYEPEVGTILPRLKDATDAADVRRIVHEEFVRWFTAEIAGPESRYESAAQAIWSAWQEHR